MPQKSNLKCYFGCTQGGPLHHFPNPKSNKLEDIEKFSAWKAVLDKSVQGKENVYIYNNILLCNKHFLGGYQLPSRRLTKNAVPTLNLEHQTSASTSGLQPLETYKPNQNEQPSASATALQVHKEHKILPEKCQGTADFLLLLNNLFDSLNDQCAIKLLKEHDQSCHGLILASVYMPESEDPPPYGMTTLVDYCEKGGLELIIAADSNAHHPLWGMENTNSRDNKLEVCIDSLESAINALNGGADELEVCGSLAEGGLTPSPGLVKEITNIIENETKWNNLQKNKKPKVNVMIRCRGGSDFCYSDNEMKTMLSDIEFYKEFGVDRFVFGALTDCQEIDKENCAKVIEKSDPIPVTFHRAFDLCKDPKTAIEDIIFLGFNRLLTSGQKNSAADEMALQLLKFLLINYGDKIEIMPGAGVNCDNANIFVKSGFNIIHSSCKTTKSLVNVNSDLKMGTNEMYVTDECIVKALKEIIKTYSYPCVLM